MSKKSKTQIAQDLRTLRTNGMMEAFSMSLAIIAGINIRNGVYIFARGIDLIPCIAFIFIGISAFLKKRSICDDYKVPWYLTYVSPIMWGISAGVQMVVPFPVSIAILGATYLILNPLIRKHIEKE